MLKICFSLFTFWKYYYSAKYIFKITFKIWKISIGRINFYVLIKYKNHPKFIMTDLNSIAEEIWNNIEKYSLDKNLVELDKFIKRKQTRTYKIFNFNLIRALLPLYMEFEKSRFANSNTLLFYLAYKQHTQFQSLQF